MLRFLLQDGLAGYAVSVPDKACWTYVAMYGCKTNPLLWQIYHTQFDVGAIMPAEKTQVLILSRTYKIEGQIDLIPGARLTDYMNNSNKFIAVTNARVLDSENNEMARAGFIDVLVNSIEVILPSDENVSLED